MKSTQGEKKAFTKGKVYKEEINSRRVNPQGNSFVETAKVNDKNKEFSAWIDAGDCLPFGDLGTLKSCLIGSRKTQPNPHPSVKQLEEWTRVAWRLKGHVMIAPLNEDLLFLKFDSQEEVVGAGK